MNIYYNLYGFSFYTWTIAFKANGLFIISGIAISHFIYYELTKNMTNKDIINNYNIYLSNFNKNNFKKI